jgi:hypothetical protein
VFPSPVPRNHNYDVFLGSSQRFVAAESVKKKEFATVLVQMPSSLSVEQAISYNPFASRRW